MRTTLTLDDDVAVQVERIRRQRDASLRDVVNEALRRGLSQMQKRPLKRERFRTKGFEGLALMIPIDNVAEAIAIAEGEFYK
jgi:Arc/MetJ family transcription regulator